jgi:hypothetical protein
LDNKYGVIYVALGPAYAIMAMVSINSIRIYSDVPISIIIDKSTADIVKLPKLDNVIIIDNCIEENRLIKSKIYDLSPYENTLYVDCDTIIKANIIDCFDYLEYFDIAVKQRQKAFPASGKGALKIFNGNKIVANQPHWNSGVIAFKKNSKTKKMFNHWSYLQKNLNYEFDQPALAQAVIQSDLRVVSLEDKWNYQDARAIYFQAGIIIHYSSNLNFRIRYMLKNAEKKYCLASSIFIDTFIKKKLEYRRKKDGLFRYYKRNMRWFLDEYIFYR